MYIFSVLPSHTSVTVTSNLLFFCLLLAVHDFRIFFVLEYILHNASKDNIHKYGIWVWYLKILYTSMVSGYGILGYYTQVWYLKILYTSIVNSKGKHRLDVEYGQTYTGDIITKLAEPNSSITITLFKLYLRVGYKNS